MKISGSVREIYAEQKEPNERLQKRVNDLLGRLARQNKWHYESRIKTDLSMALKIESGRVPDPSAIEDFFACTLVVRNLSEIDKAEKEICEIFLLSERRPKTVAQTPKRSDEFPFDDLRLYVNLKGDQSLPPTGLERIRFEVQIKSFLQHAWGIATHDLVYKTDDVSWSRQRIAYQVKAMLEHAEISIQGAERLAETVALAKTNRETEETRNIVSFLRATWMSELLPTDLRRLAENTKTVMRLANIRMDRLKELIEQEKQRVKGELPVNISPYAIIVQAIAWGEPEAVRRALADTGQRGRVLLTSEMEVPPWMHGTDMVNIIRV